MEVTLSKDELRMRLFNTFKNKGVLDKLKVSHTTYSNSPVSWKVFDHSFFPLFFCFRLSFEVSWFRS